MRRERVRGTTLVELTVAVCVLAMMMLVLVPALQSARAAARRASCIDNLGQMGLALHNYHDVSGCLPMSQVRGEGHGNGHSVFATMLPYLDQAPLYNAYNFDLENWHEANGTVVQTKVSTFLCPDNPNVENIAARELKLEGAESNSSFAKGHYGANWGGGRDRWGQHFVKQQGTYLGVMMTVITPDGRQKAPDGQPMARNVRFDDILDGSQFTLAMVEKRDSFGWAVGGWGGSEFDVHTKPNYDENDRLAQKVYSGSVHPEGVHALLCDGSVRRLEPPINQAVWYALITRAGGEVIPDSPGMSAVLSAGRDVPKPTPEGSARAGKAVGQLVEELRKKAPPAAKGPDRISLYALDVSSGAVTLVAGEPDPGLDQCGSPSWTRDGKQILFDAQPKEHLEKTRLKAIDLADGRWTIKDLGPGNCPSPSPAADRILFLRNPDQAPGDETGVWIMEADGSQRRRLGGYGRPRWSPDGHQFLIISFSNQPQVTLIDDRPVKKSGEIQIPGHRIFSIPSWAGAGTIVAVIGAEGAASGDTVALLDLADPERAAIKEVLWKKGSGLAVDPSEPIFAPATRRCVFVGSDTRGMALYTLDAGKPGPPKRLEPEGHDKLILDLAFAPDGRYVLFASNRPDRPHR
jgi:Protein of unknown function (DUF1559)/WD40-like Beta Propeller Repeat